MLFATSETSQPEGPASTDFFLQSSIISELFRWLRALCFLVHLVTVTLSSTCTSLTSELEECILCNSTIASAEGVEAENDALPLRGERLLCSGLIWVAMSLLETAEDISVAASFTPPSFSSVYLIPE